MSADTTTVNRLPPGLTILLPCAYLLVGCQPDGAHDTGRRVAVFDTIARISFRELPIPPNISPVAISQDGHRIAVGMKDGSGEIMLFNRAGDLVRQFGRSGQGPGEFRDVSALAFAPESDSLWILDSDNGRITVYAPDETEPARMIPLEGRFFSTAWASDTVLVVQGQFKDGDRAAALARAILPSGIRPVALEAGLVKVGGFDAFIRPITSSARGGIWAADFRRAELRRLDADLTLTDKIAYNAPALDVSPGNAAEWSDFMDTEPAVLGITEDATGDFWVLFGVPVDPLPSVDDPAKALQEGRIGVADLAQTILAQYTTDALQAGPVAEFVQGPMRGGLLPGGVAYYFDEDETGEVTLHLVALGSRTFHEEEGGNK